MRRFCVVSCLCANVLLWPMISVAEGGKGNDKGSRVILPASEIHDGWYFAAGEQVVIEGTVNGDAYVAGGIVRVEGVINGDLLVGGGQVTVTGRVSDDIRAAGGSVEVSGDVGKNVTVAGGSVTIGKEGMIHGGLLAACGSLILSGQVHQEASAAAGEMSLSGRVGRSLRFAGDRISLLPGGTVQGDLTVRVSDTAGVDLGRGTIGGSTSVVAEKGKAAPRLLGFSLFHFWVKLIWMLSLLVTALLLVFIVPDQLKGVGHAISGRPGLSIVWGILGFILIPLAAVILCLTLVGAPVGAFIGLLYLWALYLSQISFAVLLGQWLFAADSKRGWSLFGAVALGVIIVQVVTFIPIVRLLVILAGVFFGLGAILLVIRDAVKPRPA